VGCAEVILGDMEKSGVACEDHYIYLIKSYIKLTNMDKARTVFESFADKVGVKKEEEEEEEEGYEEWYKDEGKRMKLYVAIDLLVDGYIGANQIDGLKSFMSEVQSRGIDADEICSSMVSLYVELGVITRAEQLFMNTLEFCDQSLCDNGIKDLLTAIVKEKNHKLAQQIFDAGEKYADYETHDIMINMYRNMNLPVEAKGMADKATKYLKNMDSFKNCFRDKDCCRLTDHYLALKCPHEAEIVENMHKDMSQEHKELADKSNGRGNSDFDAWIEENQLGEHKQLLEEYGFTNMRVVKNLDEAALDKMGLNQKHHLGTRLALLAAARKAQ